MTAYEDPQVMSNLLAISVSVICPFEPQL